MRARYVAAVALAGLWLMGAGTKARADAGRVEAILQKAAADIHIQIDRHWHKGEYNHIVNLSRALISAQPKNVDLYANAAWLLWSMKRDDEAIALYELGIRNNPDTYFLYDELALYWADYRKQPAKALPYYEKSASMKDAPAGTLHMLAHVYTKLGMLEKAKATWEKAVAHPNNAMRAAAQRNLAKATEALKAKQRQ